MSTVFVIICSLLACLVLHEDARLMFYVFYQYAEFGLTGMLVTIIKMYIKLTEIRLSGF